MSRSVQILRAALGLTAAMWIAACGPAQTSLSVVLTDFAFSPASYTVPAGAEVTLELTNNGAVEHNWVLLRQGAQVTSPFGEDDEAQILYRATLGAGMSQTFTFTAPDEPGTYPVVCSVPGHHEAGMQGRLTVEP
jgi:uncharacterized cupredoxin-like copper-binding protein